MKTRRWVDPAVEAAIAKAMAERCLEQDHYWVNCASPFFRIYQACKYCGQER